MNCFALYFEHITSVAMCLIILPAAAAFAIVAALIVCRNRECTIALLVVYPLVYHPVAYTH